MNSVVITMFAKDLDAGENGTVKFTMKGKLMRRGQFIFNSWVFVFISPCSKEKYCDLV